MPFYYDSDDIGYDTGYEQEGKIFNSDSLQQNLKGESLGQIVYKCDSSGPMSKADGSNRQEAAAYAQTLLNQRSEKTSPAAPPPAKAPDTTKTDATKAPAISPDAAAKLQQMQQNKLPSPPATGPVKKKAKPNGTPPSKTEQEFRSSLKSAKVSDALIDRWMNTFPKDKKAKDKEIKTAKYHFDLLRSSPNPKETVDSKTSERYVQGEIERAYIKPMRDKGLSETEIRDALKAEGINYSRPRRLTELTNSNGKALSEKELDKLQALSEEVQKNGFSNHSSEQAQRIRTIEDHLEKVPPEQREAAEAVLHRMGFTDPSGKPTTNWTPEDFNKKMTASSTPKKEVQKLQKDIEEIQADYQKKFKKIMADVPSTRKVPEDDEKMMKAVQAANKLTEETQEKLDGKIKEIEKQDPVLGATLRQKEIDAYVEASREALTKDLRSKEDADAILYSWGVIDKPGAKGSSKGLSRDKALSTFRKVIGADRADGIPPSTQTFRREAITWHRNELVSALESTGMNRDQIVRHLTKQGYLGDETKLPPGTLEKMSTELAQMKQTLSGEKKEIQALGKKLAKESENQPESTDEAVKNQATMIKLAKPLQAKKNETKREQEERYHQDQLRHQELERASGKEEKRLDRLHDMEKMNAQQKFEASQKAMDRQQQMMQSLLQIMMQLITSILQLMGQMYQTNNQMLTVAMQNNSAGRGRR